MWRGIVIIVLFFAFAIILANRLFFLQITQHGFYKALSQGQHGASVLQKEDRGNIIAKNKNGDTTLLATNEKFPSVFVSVPEVENKKAVASSLANILGENENALFQQIQQSSSLFEVIKKRITPQQEQFIKELGQKGVHIQYETIRAYPQGSLASQLIGFTNQDGEGQYGIEKQYNNSLKGKAGIFVSRGSDIILAIDPHIQLQSESILEEGNLQYNFEKGTIIVADPQNGNILAIANFPTFNVNEYAKVKNFEIFQNPAAEEVFEPGSIFKSITMASALDAHAVFPETTYTDNGILKIGKSTIQNYGNRVWGLRSMKEVLEFSINTGAVFAEQQLGNTRFLDYIRKFGIFDSTKIGLPGEINSENKEFLQGREINFQTASFGQGIEMTPLQLVRAYSALANQGKLANLFVVEQSHTTQLAKRAISQLSAKTITSMLVNVIEQGYGKAAKIPGYYIAGKTGTAQISWSALGIQKSGYSDKTIQSFIGYGPAYNAKFLILIKLTNPNTKTAEYSALPLFRKLAKYVIDYLQIPPDYEP